MKSDKITYKLYHEGKLIIKTHKEVELIKKAREVTYDNIFDTAIIHKVSVKEDGTKHHEFFTFTWFIGSRFELELLV